MLHKALEALRTYDYGVDRAELDPIDDAIVKSQSDAAGRRDLEAELLNLVTSDASRCAKDYALRKLKIIGTPASIPTLAGLLSDATYSHMARYALESMPVEEAGVALRNAVPNLSGTLKAGVIASLGVRQDSAAVATLAALLKDSDATVATAAAHALGAIRSQDAAKALSNAKPNAAAVPAAIDSSLACAEARLAAGDKSGALSIYRELSKGDQPKHVSLAAKRGMLACLSKG